MHATAPISTMAFATLRANSVPFLLITARPTSAMATALAAAPESKGSPTITMATINTI
jgi:hypothetical protein